MRWTLTDPATAETWTMPINPDSMTSPHPPKDFASFAKGIKGGHNRSRSFMVPASPVEWTWEGAIRTPEHHDALEAWSKKGTVRVTDHLGRTWEVVMQRFEPSDRRPTPNTPWRMRYSMTALILRQV